MKKTKQSRGPLREVTTALAICGLLSACGGGGGGGGSTTSPSSATPVVISDTNAPTVAAQAMDAGAAGSVGGAALSGVQITSSAAAGLSLGRLLDSALNAVHAVSPSTLVTGVTASQALPCTNGGSVTVTINAASTVNLSPGDHMDLSFSNCVEGTATLAGLMSMTIRSANSALTYMDVDATFVSFTGTVAGVGERLDGTVHLIDDATGTTTETVQLTSNSLTVARLVSGAVRTTRTLSGYSYQEVIDLSTGDTSDTFAYNATGSFPKLGSVSWSATTLQPFITPGNATYPTSGSGRVTGANGATISATVVPTGLSLDVDRNGDSTVDSTRTLTWAEVEAEL